MDLLPVLMSLTVVLIRPAPVVRLAGTFRTRLTEIITIMAHLVLAQRTHLMKHLLLLEGVLDILIDQHFLKMDQLSKMV